LVIRPKLNLNLPYGDRLSTLLEKLYFHESGLFHIGLQNFNQNVWFYAESNGFRNIFTMNTCKVLWIAGYLKVNVLVKVWLKMMHLSRPASAFQVFNGFGRFSSYIPSLYSWTHQSWILSNQIDPFYLKLYGFIRKLNNDCQLFMTGHDMTGEGRDIVQFVDKPWYSFQIHWSVDYIKMRMLFTNL
jgi:hypothetical protein